MARRIGIAEATTTKVTGRPPILVLIAGATGVGKSTTAVKIANEHSFARLLSTDAIREIMRVQDTTENLALHRSSFSKGDSENKYPIWNNGADALMDSLKINGVKVIF